jgi:ribonuclease HI
VVLVTGDDRRELWDGKENSTYQRAEIQAAITALEALDAPTKIEIVSDSMYLTNCGSGKWKRKTNRDLWERLDAAAAPHQVEYRWIRGHAGNPGNERAHVLAMLAIRRGVS